MIVSMSCSAKMANDEFAGGNRLAEAGAEVVQRDDVFAGCAELPHDVAADVSGPAGHK
jgi:urease gamma subunit